MMVALFLSQPASGVMTNYSFEVEVSSIDNPYSYFGLDVGSVIKGYFTFDHEIFASDMTGTDEARNYGFTGGLDLPISFNFSYFSLDNGILSDISYLDGKMDYAFSMDFQNSTFLLGGPNFIDGGYSFYRGSSGPISPVPEPATLALVSSAIIGAAIVNRKKKNGLKKTSDA